MGQVTVFSETQFLICKVGIIISILGHVEKIQFDNEHGALST